MSPSDSGAGTEGVPDAQRRAARSFGGDPQRYDRARPRYPEALIQRVLAGSPGRLVLDVGTGTGILARQLQAAGCEVLGVDPDARLAEFARGTGVRVEVSTFEEWEPAGRAFDAVVSGESWHWIDPVSGAAKAAEVLRPGGRLAAFWYTGRPPAELEDAFLAVYRRILPASIATRLEREPLEQAQAAMRTRTADGIRTTGTFEAPEEWWCEWVQPYTREQWLDALQTAGGAIPESELGELLSGIGDAIDAAGGSFTMNYRAFAVTAARSR